MTMNTDHRTALTVRSRDADATDDDHWAGRDDDHADVVVVFTPGIDGGESSTGCEPPGVEILAFYPPLVAWAPLLFFAARDYHRRMLQ